ncbi:MAG: hypothetical protein CME25_09800 [Gemmatimonadetes bacterium]|nr:hypothetical protein [Gemmatimonadota bacterium]
MTSNTPQPSPYDASGTGWPREILALIGTLSVLLAVFQYRTLAKFSVMGPGVRYKYPRHFFEEVQNYVPLDRIDGLMALAILAVCICILVLEIWKKRLSQFFSNVFDSEVHTLLFIGIGSLLAVRFYFSLGDSSWVADTSAHTAYAFIASHAFRNGELPIWSNFICAGSPYGQFYGFLFSYLVGFFDLLFSDLFFSIKWVTGWGHVVSGLGMYLFAKTLTRSRRTGAIAGAAYVLCFWHTQQVLIMGRLHLSVLYALLPYPFYFLERLRIRSKRPASTVLGAVTLGCLAYTHPGHAFWATAFLGLYVLIRYLGATDRNTYPLAHTVMLFCGGVVLGAYMTLPIWLERGETVMYWGYDISGFPDPTWKHLLFWSNYRFNLFPLNPSENHWYGGYIGVSLTLLALVGLAAPFARRQVPGIVVAKGAAICLLAIVILIFGYRWSVFQSLFFVRAANSGRYLTLLAFFLSLVAGVGAANLISILGRKRTRTGIFTGIFLLIILDLGPTTFQQPYLSEGTADNLYKLPDEVYQEDIPSNQVPRTRVFYTTHNVYRHQIISWLSASAGLSTFLEMFIEAPLSVKAFSRPLESILNKLFGEFEDAETLTASEDFFAALKGLYLSNTKHIVTYRPEADNVLYWPFPQSTPVMVAGKAIDYHYPIKELEEPEVLVEFIKMLNEMGRTDLSKGSSEQILLTGFEGVEDLGTKPEVQVLDHQVWNQRVEIDLQVTERCFARLAYAYYPYLRVSVNGTEANPISTADRFIALRLGAGRHRIVIEPFLSPLRKLLLILNICLVAGGLVWIFRSKRNRSGGPENAR